MGAFTCKTLFVKNEVSFDRILSEIFKTTPQACLGGLLYPDICKFLSGEENVRHIEALSEQNHAFLTSKANPKNQI